MARLSPGELKWRLIAAIPRRPELGECLRELYRRDRSSLLIYAIQEGEDGPVKIGQTTGPAYVRVAALQTGNSSELRGLAAWRGLPGEEKFIHDAFGEHRIRGEWFRPAPELLDFLLWEGGVFCDWEKAE